MMVKKYTVGYQMGIFVANLIFDDKKNPKSFFLYLTYFQKSFFNISFLFRVLFRFAHFHLILRQ